MSEKSKLHADGLDPDTTIDEYAQRMMWALEREEAVMADDGRMLAKRLIDARKQRRGESRWEDKGGSLVVTVRERGKNSTSLTFTWATLTPLNIDNGYKMHRRQLAKGRGLSYPRTTLMKHARPWEVEMIMETEEALTELRRRARKMAQLRRSLREYMKVLEFDGLHK